MVDGTVMDKKTASGAAPAGQPSAQAYSQVQFSDSSRGTMLPQAAGLPGPGPPTATQTTRSMSCRGRAVESACTAWSKHAVVASKGSECAGTTARAAAVNPRCPHLQAQPKRHAISSGLCAGGRQVAGVWSVGCLECSCSRRGHQAGGMAAAHSAHNKAHAQAHPRHKGLRGAQRPRGPGGRRLQLLDLLACSVVTQAGVRSPAPERLRASERSPQASRTRAPHPRAPLAMPPNPASAQPSAAPAHRRRRPAARRHPALAPLRSPGRWPGWRRAPRRRRRSG